MQYTIEQKKELMDRAKELRDSGKGYADIAIALGISKSTAHFLLNPEKKYRSKPSRAVARYLVFVNSARDRVKVYAANNTIAYHRAEKRGSIDLRVIQMIPRAFNANGKLNYDEALKLAVEKALLDRKSKGIKAFVSGR